MFTYPWHPQEEQTTVRRSKLERMSNNKDNRYHLVRILNDFKISPSLARADRERMVHGMSSSNRP